MIKTGVQFYTVRDFCKTTKDFAETLKKVADIGYKYVQISGTCEYEAEWLKEQLRANGLKCTLTHIPAEKLIDNTAEVIAAHNVFDCEYIGLGYHHFGGEDFDADNYNKFVADFKPVAEKIAAAGKYFMYHNHDGEFVKVNGKTVLEKLAEDFPPEKLGIILDTFWVQAGGGDPAQYLEKLSGRVPCIHLKDYAYGKKMAVLGEGNINFDRVFENAEKAGTRFMFVEQDDCNGENPFDCLKRSYEYLKSNGFN